MIYNRGHALDYDGWQSAGAHGWSYADCLPYFKKAQTHALGADEYRGGSGPLHVTRRLQRGQPLYQAFLDAAVQAGYPFTEDMNGYQQEGVGWLDMTVHKGERSSASAAYLTESVLSRKNLTVRTDTFVNKVVFDGKRAVGIEVEPSKASSGEPPKQIRAAKEVILSGGAVNSPQLLMVSGVGDAQHLKEVGVPLVHPPPSSRRTKLGGSLGRVLTRNVQEACHALPRHTALPTQNGMDGDPVALITDRSRANPRELPVIQPNYLDTENDRVDLRNGVRLTREVLQQQAFDDFRGDAVSPIDDVQSDAEIDAWVRQHASTDYHPSSTNRMGLETDATTVVNFQTKVHGLEGLRVVDASIMPNNVSGNLNAPTIMLAEKAADIILSNPTLPKSDVPVYEAHDWETSQR
ncbi:unnamed protein product [Phytophthora fragariaefolia]|uniref:Unnamed protein product n=1 Tax=Phytophthora fragariaefolia TaxID=1490495 RepID=A0A9W7D4H5_9STRA|nr:unnamed protein product [Phytophthora fragariaefolia]